MQNGTADRFMETIERKVLREAAAASLEFTCPDCGCVLEVPLNQNHIPETYPCGNPFDLSLTIKH